MIRKVDRLELRASGEKIALEERIFGVADQLDKLAVPSTVTEVFKGIPLANNYSTPYRAGIFGEDYSDLDIALQYTPLSNGDFYTEGVQFILQGGVPSRATIVELMQHPDTTPLAEIPFCIVPAGSDKPSAVTTFEQVVSFLGDITQFQRYNPSEIFDPRNETPNLNDALRIVVEAISEQSKSRVSQKTFTTEAPLVSNSLESLHILERKIGVTVTHIDGRQKLVSLQLEGDHEIFGGVIKQRLQMQCDARRKRSEIFNALTSTQTNLDNIQSRQNTANEQDTIATLARALDQLENDLLSTQNLD